MTGNVSGLSKWKRGRGKYFRISGLEEKLLSRYGDDEAHFKTTETYKRFSCPHASGTTESALTSGLPVTSPVALFDAEFTSWGHQVRKLESQPSFELDGSGFRVGCLPLLPWEKGNEQISRTGEVPVSRKVRRFGLDNRFDEFIFGAWRSGRAVVFRSQTAGLGFSGPERF
ncbi:hypothetical protein AXG93_4735s1020 [Marchantia polymorpha subsp. ruderalis]|uniref:Uncharacterized protein n=1 Tax=Marchantia polymorpha subsp. ruderalis TaxID=1480154 RepID=A0A176WQW3_MARPO|nr:hypothetical protein AXG93_4735s1020 [Marchantia polymorpha subsp. ruderalis]